MENSYSRNVGFIHRLPKLCIRIPIILCFLYLCVIFTFFLEDTLLFKRKNASIEGRKTFLIDTPGCRIPNFEIFPPSIAKYLDIKKSLSCVQPNQPDLTESKGNILYFFPERMKPYLKKKKSYYARYLKKIDKFQSLRSFNNSEALLNLQNIFFNCCYKSIERITQSVDKYNNECDKRWRLGKNCIPIRAFETAIDELDAIVVTCSEHKNHFYTNVHPLVQKRDDAIIPKNVTVKNRLNVILFGTDSVSRLNFIRSNPKTHRYITEELKAFDLKGYNRVADNTFQNLIPVLTGFTKSELLSHPCYNNSYGSMGVARKFDDCPIIWKDFKEKGYITVYFEDAPNIGMFHYLKSGFVNKPTDHYSRPSFLVSSKLIGRNTDKYCQRNKLSLEIVHDYSIDILRTYPDRPTFSLMWSSALTHTLLKNIRSADEPHLRYLKTLKQIGVLERSFLFFMSDHGFRFGDFRKTLLGKFEENMPYLYIVIPDWFRERFPEATRNLEKNTETLTTHFDLRATLLDILDLNYENTAYVTENVTEPEKSISLFQEIPTTRTCQDIGFDYKYCSCQTYMPLENTTAISEHIETYIKDYLVAMLKPMTLCAPVQEVVLEKVLIGIRDTEFFKHVHEDIISIQAGYNPGNAVIEATMIWDRSGDTPSFKVIGDISRINSYGKQSHCITDKELQKFCICKDML